MMSFKKNMGSADRTIRIVAAIILAALAFMGTVSGALAVIFYVLAAVFVVTSLVNFCPLYLPFKISTLKK